MIQDGDGVEWMPLPAIRRSLVLAVVLHAVGALLLVLAIRFWPAVTPAPPVAQLDLDLAVPPAPASAVSEPTVLEQALAMVSTEARPAAMPEAPVPEARPAGIPEPVVMTASVSGNMRSETFQMPLEDTRGLALMPLPVPAAKGVERGGRPIALSGIQPHYPYSARVRGEAGRVLVHLRVTRQGEVESAAVNSSSGFPSLDESALASARKARFKPAERNGQAVPADMDLQFEFRLQD